MSAYERAVRTIEGHPELRHFQGPKDPSLVDRAERELDLSFPPEYRRFLEEYGAGSFGGSEIYGLVGDDFRDSGIPDAIWYTLTLRAEASLPPDLVVVYSSGDGEELCVRAGDGAIVSFLPGSDEDVAVVAADFGSWLDEIVSEEVAFGLPSGWAADP
jgi:antitoxin YobK